MRYLIIIPARCGSKGIPKKNIVLIKNKPLIQYSIEIANNLKKFGLADQVLVSTDCNEIKNIALKLGASVPFLRPKKISTDKSKSIDFILHAISYYENLNVFFDAVILLQPTSPIRSIKLLQDAISLFNKNNIISESLISCFKEEYINDLVMYNKFNKSDLLKPVNINHNKGVRRQDHGFTYVRNGSVYITSIEYLKKEKKIICDNPILLEMNKNDSINIDTKEDLELIRNYYENRHS